MTTQKHFRAPSGSKQAKQAASDNSTGPRRERNKYAPKPDPVKAAERAAWNARVQQQAVREKAKTKPWVYRLDDSTGAMFLLDPDGKRFDGQWAASTAGPFVLFKGVSYPQAIAYPREKSEQAIEIVGRILKFLNEGVIS